MASIWSNNNPQAIVETQLHPGTVFVWCAFWAAGIIGPYVFKNDDGQNVRIKDERYRGNFSVSQFKSIGVSDTWSQQAGAACHTARYRITLLKETFNEQLISRNGPVNW
ncbi:hypothetical protein Trydic_g12334 [Trypoxylus dichotomus]